jgi:hypothetical protein
MSVFQPASNLPARPLVGESLSYGNALGSALELALNGRRLEN